MVKASAKAADLERAKSAVVNFFQWMEYVFDHVNLQT